MTTEIKEFDEAVSRAEQWVAQLTLRLGWQDRRKAHLALRAALHALRDCLPLDEAVQLGTQLPTLLRGAYYEGWRLRWSPTVGQFDGLVKLGPGCRQAANLIMSPIP